MIYHCLTHMTLNQQELRHLNPGFGVEGHEPRNTFV